MMVGGGLSPPPLIQLGYNLLVNVDHIVAGHHQGGSVPTEASAPQYYPVPGLLPEGAHGLGERPTPTPAAARLLALLRPTHTLVWSPGRALGTAWWGDLGKEDVSLLL